MRFNFLILFFLVLFIGLSPFIRAQSPVNPTPEQLLQMSRLQPTVDISAPVAAVATLDPPVVRPGEKSVYRVTFNATAVSVSQPQNLSAPAGLKINFNCSGQTMQDIGGGFQNFATFDYDIRADAIGRFTLPEYRVKVYGQEVVVPSVQLEVKNDLPPSHEPARELLIEPSSSSVFIGETFNIKVLLPATAAGVLESVSDVQLLGDGFVIDKNSMKLSIGPVESKGRHASAFIYETSITPIAAGELKISAQGFTTGLRLNNPNVINGQITVQNNPPQYILLDSEMVAVNVRPLPTESELPGFLGAVGDYLCDPPVLETNFLKVGEPVQLRVVIRGEKNLTRIDLPAPPHVRGWQIFPAERGAVIPGRANHHPGLNFEYTLIPLLENLNATPEIPFSCFDPVRGEYVDLTIPSLPVKVVAGEFPTNADASLMLSENSFETESKSALSKLAASPGKNTGGLVPWQMRRWFPLVPILPVLGFCGLWCWERRRRYLEQHPEIIRRREARRALRRERFLLEKAAANGDANSFVRSAINALQIVSAPHYPATPRALVSRDVLQILTASEREGKAGEIVRHFYAVADAATFANHAENSDAMLAEKTALKEILLKLEARL